MTEYYQEVVFFNSFDGFFVFGRLVIRCAVAARWVEILENPVRRLRVRSWRSFGENNYFVNVPYSILQLDWFSEPKPH